MDPHTQAQTEQEQQDGRHEKIDEVGIFFSTHEFLRREAYAKSRRGAQGILVAVLVRLRIVEAVEQIDPALEPDVLGRALGQGGHRMI